ncbi:MAG: hypothetical protein HKN73_07045 [Gemmatimonadetes bacterium]|nr:hypothetical protein [Gemmatimonadota bacterium]
MRRHGLLVAPMAMAAAFTVPASAQGHGPIYGLSTPTLGQGGWSLDIGSMARFADGASTLMLRPMLGYGITEDLQVFGSLPLPLARDGSVLPVRAFARMPATRDLEIGFGWRPHRAGVGVGARQETTVWLALDQPLDGTRRGIQTAPGLFGSAVTGYASRTVYAWVGGAYRRHASRNGDRLGDVAMGSLVLGYRPTHFRGDYPSPDWRGFIEVVGEWLDEDTLEGRPVSETGGRQLYLAVTALGLYGSWGVAGGPAFPLYQEMKGAGPSDLVRFAVNVTFWR